MQAGRGDPGRAIQSFRAAAHCCRSRCTRSHAALASPALALVSSSSSGREASQPHSTNEIANTRNHRIAAPEQQKGRELPPALASYQCAGLQPRCIHTDLVWVTVVSVSRHLSRPMPDCLKPPQIEVMSPWSKQLTHTMPASMSRAALWATETSEVQIEAASP